MPSKRRGKKNLNINVAELGMTLIKSNLIGYALTAIFVILAALLLTYTNLSDGFEKWIILCGVIASAYLVGSDTAKSQGKQGYKWGAVGGASYLLIFIVISLLTGGTESMSVGYLVTLAVLCLISSSLAGMISLGMQK